jgi:hypothetical protein
MQQTITDEDRKKAAICLTKCTVCKSARNKQKGFAFWFVKNLEPKFCPYCKAYKKVYGRKVHEPLPKSVSGNAG